ncbi:MAG TPA: TonB family protein [Gemmatimonadales bacterium]|nr:TonB family protein [Gemmatimonadales bacterium]
MTSPHQMTPRPRPALTLRLPRRPRRRGWGLGLSLAAHALLVALLATGMRRDWARTPRPGPIAIVLPGVGGGGGGDRATYITPPRAPAEAHLRPRPRERPVVAPPDAVPPPVVQPVTPEPPDTEPSAPSGSAADSSLAVGPVGPGGGPGGGGGGGGGVGAGTGGGAGRGAGGEGGRARPPEPRQLVLPPSDFPRELRGRQVEVTFFVTPDGRVEHVEVVPAIAHGGFARKFDETMRNYRFRPARSPEGAPVPGSTTLTVSFF